MKEILSRAKEVKETFDNEEAAWLVQSGNWVIVQAAIQTEGIRWVLIRI